MKTKGLGHLIYIYSLLNVRFGSLPGPHGLLLIYMWGENSDRENPVIHLPAFGTRLLGACLAPAGRLWYFISLLFQPPWEPLLP